jgi:hypothetical protein
VESFISFHDKANKNMQQRRLGPLLTILSKSRIPIEMKWIDWQYLIDLLPPLQEALQAIYDRCHAMGISYLMGLSCEWSKEVVAQLYSTFYIDDNGNVMHFTLGGKRFSITLSEFDTLFKLHGATTSNTFNSLCTFA